MYQGRVLAFLLVFSTEHPALYPPTRNVLLHLVPQFLRLLFPGDERAKGDCQPPLNTSIVTPLCTVSPHSQYKLSLNYGYTHGWESRCVGEEKRDKTIYILIKIFCFFSKRRSMWCKEGGVSWKQKKITSLNTLLTWWFTSFVKSSFEKKKSRGKMAPQKKSWASCEEEGG